MKYLGIRIGFLLLAKANFDELMTVLKAKLIGWSSCKLFLVGNFFVDNQIIMSSTW
jgi:hypothetical protein